MSKQGQYVYAKAVCGLTVRVPRSKLGQWQKAQSRLSPEQIAEDRRTLALVRSKLAGK